MIILGIETSCDETAAAVVHGNGSSLKILSNIIASQQEVHQKYGGIVPELASRRHMEVILPVIQEALDQAKVTLAEIEAIAVTVMPGLVGSLLVGLQVAKGIAFAQGIPFVGVSHLEGHLQAALLEHPKVTYPYLALLVSGGHTLIYHVSLFSRYELIGGTRDDAAGEAFDKVAKILGLGYPGGPLIDKLARDGNPKAIKFPQGKISGHPFDFSFSGLKTAVLNYVRQSCRGEVTSPLLENICASFQETVVDDLVRKTVLAAEEKGVKTIVVSGGVACNSRLREKLPQAFFPSPLLCTDNAAMIAAVGYQYLKKGQTSPWSLNAVANQDAGNPSMNSGSA
ncbi:MAG: tRNA (adenosine(37)-N6)-threonylcarbamoyltransferase complex transferase subunit TsaD [Deltaproteobacteria bacterium]|nr:tRNA (adenosine(37)-N6)-threonylcarbamoyltransferase complex transferase subunit TsaD [Deltaproteobacteria bacterium]